MGIKLRKLSVLALLAVTVFFGHNAQALDDFAITITNSNANRNQNLIFDEKNIGPGFNATYNIKINNQSTQYVKISLHDVAESPANSLSLDELHLKISRNNVIITEIKPDADMIGSEFICVSPFINDAFALDVYLDSNLGNEYQDSSYYVDMTFQADASECQTEPIDSVDSGNSENVRDRNGLPLLPNTGESRAFYYFLYCAIAFSIFLTIVFLILFILARRKDDRYTDKKHETSKGSSEKNHL